ncbi:uncharacterized protein LY79DRAFT_534611 [Colletotrichum navitas]|uniref:Uncharacterized protein n=1 Tax=Colletotrichum navitas TaxID=681940 RepID=A0AAD8VD33_9PEZI|nr:uncharacterized protein LY79DRAFT_534611 [Colletotrichum navitas]KAK1600768.1 hypothetical protein LY79DRAFT_534611 [Colletotrichum navitas]
MSPVKALSKVPYLPWEVREMLLPTNLPTDDAMHVHCILDTILTMGASLPLAGSGHVCRQTRLQPAFRGKARWLLHGNIYLFGPWSFAGVTQLFFSQFESCPRSSLEP